MCFLPTWCILTQNVSEKGMSCDCCPNVFASYYFCTMRPTCFLYSFRKHCTFPDVPSCFCLLMLGNSVMPICLPKQCLALVCGLPPPGDTLFRESPRGWIRLQGVGHRHETCPRLPMSPFLCPKVILFVLSPFFCLFFGPLQGKVFVPQSIVSSCFLMRFCFCFFFSDPCSENAKATVPLPLLPYTVAQSQSH